MPSAHEHVMQVIGYHQETKHHFFHYARALGYLDWASQPNPFRRFTGAPAVQLPLLHPDGPPGAAAYESLFQPGAVDSQPLTIASVSRMLEYALAVTAWKQAGSTRWALRSNPSSGNLHPTEGYLVVPAIEGIGPAGVYHYAAREHLLERRATCSDGVFRALTADLPPSAWLMGTTSVHWREAWKYGERAFRYCQHDVGHALGSARVAAAALGWRLVVLDDLGDEEIAHLLGVNREQDFTGAEREHPDWLAVVWPASQGGDVSLTLPESAIEDVSRSVWQGHANRLSAQDPVPWDIIEVVAGASCKPNGDRGRVLNYASTCGPTEAGTPRETAATSGPAAGQIVRQRRSAVAFDATTSISASTLYRMLRRVLPHAHLPPGDRPVPWDSVPWEPAVHLGLFVHRVEGLRPGLYACVRDGRAEKLLREAMHAHFEWSRPAGCPEDLAFYGLQFGDCRKLAAQVSCHQDIAADGAFSLGMLAEFEPVLHARGAPWYRRLFWEAGIIGQVLYLEAEAAGVRATGIGCFFDDPVHQVFGLTSQAFQSLYHFTVGGPVEDRRLTTLPAYPPADVEPQ